MSGGQHKKVWMTFLDRGTHPNKVKYYGCIRIDIKKAGTIARLILFCHRLESTEAKKKKLEENMGAIVQK